MLWTLQIVQNLKLSLVTLAQAPHFGNSQPEGLNNHWHLLNQFLKNASLHKSFQQVLLPTHLICFMVSIQLYWLGVFNFNFWILICLSLFASVCMFRACKVLFNFILNLLYKYSISSFFFTSSSFFLFFSYFSLFLLFLSSSLDNYYYY